MEIFVDKIIFREDLYPRIETNARKVQEYAEDLDVLPAIEVNGWSREVQNGELEVSFGFIYPNVCPPSLTNLSAGIIRGGVLYTSGSVSKHYAKLQQSHSRLRTKPHVYFIRSEQGGPVKIGLARNISKRLASLQTAHPYHLRVIAVIPFGGRTVERSLHKHFASSRILLSEWFEWTREIEDVLS